MCNAKVQCWNNLVYCNVGYFADENRIFFKVSIYKL